MQASRLILLIVLLLISPLVILNPALAYQDAPSPQTATITETGFCSNPDVDSSGAVWEEEYDLSDIHPNITEVISVEITLSWTDDEGSRSDADSFIISGWDGLDATPDDSGSSGSLTASLDQEGMATYWYLTVQCTEAGPTPVGPIGIIVQTDPGNSWSLTFRYTYLVEEPMPPGPHGPPPEIQAIMEDPIFWIHVGLMILSTIGFGITGLLAGINIIKANQWKDSAEKFKRWLANPRLYRLVAVHTWVAFFIAAVPLGMYVSGKVYGWANAWTGFPAFWNPWFYDITNADNTSTIALVLFGIPLWLNRRVVMEHKSHGWFFRRIPWVRKQYETAPPPLISEREMAIIYFLLGVMIFLVFAVQPHGN
jgi:hypothetical protein